LAITAGDVSAETPRTTVAVSPETPHTVDISAETPHRFDVSAETPRTRADALMVLVESFLPEGARSRRGGTPTEVRLPVTEDELQRGGFIEKAGYVGVSAETSRRLACDAAVVEVVENPLGLFVLATVHWRSALSLLRTSQRLPLGAQQVAEGFVSFEDEADEHQEQGGDAAAQEDRVADGPLLLHEAPGRAVVGPIEPIVPLALEVEVGDALLELLEVGLSLFKVRGDREVGVDEHEVGRVEQVLVAEHEAAIFVVDALLGLSGGIDVER
jgi:hypothetical protein